MKDCFTIYQSLLKWHGPQGWWPLSCLPNNKGYHPNDFSYPSNQLQTFEIAIGAILTQNTNWSNVVKALDNLVQEDCLDPQKLLKLDDAIMKK